MKTSVCTFFNWRIFFVGGVMGLASSVSAATFTWEAGSDGSFNDASNWSGGSTALPGSEDTASFRNNFDGTVSLDEDTTITTLEFRNTGSTPVVQHLDLSGFSLNATTEIQVGSNSTSNRVSITRGTLSTGRLRLGYSSGTTNRLEISGVGTVFTTGQVRLAHNEGSTDNTWSISDGANVTTAQVFVGYAESTFNNRLEIHSGGYLTAGNTQVRNGEVNLAHGTLELPQLRLRSNGVLSGEGTIKGAVLADNSSESNNIRVMLGNDGFGTLTVEGTWNNNDLQVFMALGNDDPGNSTSIGFDHLDISGAWTHGGSVTIDLAELNEYDSGFLFHLIAWGSEVGERSLTNIHLLNNPEDIGYEWRTDGLYLTAIPEVSTSALVLMGTVGILLRRRLRSRLG